MDYIDIRIAGKIGGIPVTPDTYDIKHLARVLEYADALVRGKASRRDKADVITLEILERSHVNRLHIALHQRFVEVSAVLGGIAGSYSLQGLDRLTADAVRGLHSEAKHLGVTIELRSSAPEYATPP